MIKMNRNDWLNFEIYVGDLLEQQDIRDANKLRDFSDELHQQLEMAVQDYANDVGIVEAEEWQQGFRRLWNYTLYHRIATGVNEREEDESD